VKDLCCAAAIASDDDGDDANVGEEFHLDDLAEVARVVILHQGELRWLMIDSGS